MADNQDPSKQNPPADPPKEPTPEEAENAFFEKMFGRMDQWFDNKVKSYRQTATSRTGRTTLPGMLADIFFPEKPEK